MIFDITFTGIDEWTDLDRVIELQSRHPYVEWGVLYSQKNAGKENRYPNTNWIRTFLLNSHLNISVHICGKGATTNWIEGDHREFDDLGFPRRWQLNFNVKETGYSLVELKDKFFLINSRFNWPIIQHNNNNEEFIEMIFEEMKKTRKRFYFSYLFDSSLGNGVSPSSWPTPLNSGVPYWRSVGYAGGLNPDNIEYELPRILKASADYPFWIDMESGVRTDDKFDLDKVEDVITKCVKINKEYESSVSR